MGFIGRLPASRSHTKEGTRLRFTTPSTLAISSCLSHSTVMRGRKIDGSMAVEGEKRSGSSGMWVVLLYRHVPDGEVLGELR